MQQDLCFTVESWHPNQTPPNLRDIFRTIHERIGGTFIRAGLVVGPPGRGRSLCLYVKAQYIEGAVESIWRQQGSATYCCFVNEFNRGWVAAAPFGTGHPVLN